MALRRAGQEVNPTWERAIPGLFALVLVGLVLGDLAAIIFPCPLRRSVALACLAGLSATLALPGFSTL